MITKDKNEQLRENFMKNEMKEELGHMYPTKLPGLEGLATIFYQYQWDTKRGCCCILPLCFEQRNGFGMG